MLCRIILCIMKEKMNRETNMLNAELKTQVIALLDEKETLLLNNASSLEINAIDSLLNALLAQ